MADLTLKDDRLFRAQVWKNKFERQGLLELKLRDISYKETLRLDEIQEGEAPFRQLAQAFRGFSWLQESRPKEFSSSIKCCATVGSVQIRLSKHILNEMFINILVLNEVDWVMSFVKCDEQAGKEFGEQLLREIDALEEKPWS